MMWLLLAVFIGCAGYGAVQVFADGPLWLAWVALSLFVVWRWWQLDRLVCFTATFDGRELRFRHLWHAHHAFVGDVVRIEEGRMGEGSQPTHTFVLRDGERAWMAGGNSDDFVSALRKAAPHISVEPVKRRWFRGTRNEA